MEQAVMGQFLRSYPQTIQNLNSFIHGFYKPRYAFVDVRRAVITQLKKLPDVSLYDKLIEWDKMRSMTDAVIIRLGQNLWVDEQFARNWAEAKKRAMRRGGYWFYDGRVSPGAQADLLANLIRDDKPEMEIWIDWERNYGGAFEGLANVVAMMQRVEALLPGVKVGLYTGYYYFIGSSNPLTNASQYTYLKTRPLWEAWYTNDASIVKIPTPWMSLLFWQYGTPAIGAQYGSQKLELDMSFFNGTQAEFDARYNTTPPPLIVDGYQEFRAFGTQIHLWRGVAVKAMVTNNGGKLVSPVEIAQRTGANYVVNVDGWDTSVPASGYHSPLSLAASDGDFYEQTQYAFRPFIQFDKSHKPSVGHQKPVAPFNLGSGTRYSVRDGVNAVPNSNEPQYLEADPRTGVGHTANGKTILCVVDGRSDTSGGVTLAQLAQIMLWAGAVGAVELDGGDSSILVRNGVKVSRNGDLINGVRTPRPTVNSLCIWTGESGMATRYEAKAIGDNTKLRPNHNTLSDFNPARAYPMNTKFHGDVLWVADATNKDVSQNVGDIWLAVTDVNGIAMNAWVAITHQGKPICTLVDNGVPAQAPSIFITHTFNDALSVTDESGKVTEYAATFTVPNVEYKPK